MTSATMVKASPEPDKKQKQKPPCLLCSLNDPVIADKIDTTDPTFYICSHCQTNRPNESIKAIAKTIQKMGSGNSETKSGNDTSDQQDIVESDLLHETEDCSCESCTNKRQLEEEHDLQELQKNWLTLRFAVRQMYRDGLSDMDCNTCKGKTFEKPRLISIVDKLSERDPHQLFLRLETQAREYVMELLPDIKTILVNPEKFIVNEKDNCTILNDPMESVDKTYSLRLSFAHSKYFLKTLLDNFADLENTAKLMTVFLFKLENDHIVRFGLSWELVNCHLFEAIIYRDSLVQSHLPGVLKYAGIDFDVDEDTGNESVKVKIPPYYSNDTEWCSISNRWTEFQRKMKLAADTWKVAEVDMEKFTAEQMKIYKATLKAKRNMLKKDLEFFKMQSRKLDDYVKNNKQGKLKDISSDIVRKALRRQCSADDDASEEGIVTTTTKQNEDLSISSELCGEGGYVCKNCDVKQKCACEQCRIEHDAGHCAAAVNRQFDLDQLTERGLCPSPAYDISSPDLSSSSSDEDTDSEFEAMAAFADLPLDSITDGDGGKQFTVTEINGQDGSRKLVYRRVVVGSGGSGANEQFHIPRELFDSEDVKKRHIRHAYGDWEAKNNLPDLLMQLDATLGLGTNTDTAGAGLSKKDGSKGGDSKAPKLPSTAVLVESQGDSEKGLIKERLPPVGCEQAENASSKSHKSLPSSPRMKCNKSSGRSSNNSTNNNATSATASKGNGGLKQRCHSSEIETTEIRKEGNTQTFGMKYKTPSGSTIFGTITAVGKRREPDGSATPISFTTTSSTQNSKARGKSSDHGSNNNNKKSNSDSSVNDVWSYINGENLKKASSKLKTHTTTTTTQCTISGITTTTRKKSDSSDTSCTDHSRVEQEFIQKLLHDGDLTDDHKELISKLRTGHVEVIAELTRMAKEARMKKISEENDSGDDYDSSSESNEHGCGNGKTGDGKYCNCCFCELFGQPGAPSNNSQSGGHNPQTKERLRLKLKKKREKETQNGETVNGASSKKAEPLDFNLMPTKNSSVVGELKKAQCVVKDDNNTGKDQRDNVSRESNGGVAKPISQQQQQPLQQQESRGDGDCIGIRGLQPLDELLQFIEGGSNNEQAQPVTKSSKAAKRQKPKQKKPESHTKTTATKQLHQESKLAATASPERVANKNGAKQKENGSKKSMVKNDSHQPNNNNGAAGGARMKEVSRRAKPEVPTSKLLASPTEEDIFAPKEIASDDELDDVDKEVEMFKKLVFDCQPKKNREKVKLDLGNFMRPSSNSITTSY